MRRVDPIHALVTVAVAATLLGGGCAELPLDNEPPEAPYLESDGAIEPGLGVAIAATCRDPDGDRVTLQFTAISGSIEVPFEWTSFVENRATEIFYLQLAAGDWVVEAVPRDELDEVGEPTWISLDVHF